MNIQELAKRYGLTVEEMKRYSIRPLEQVKTEDPELYKLATYIPPALKDYIEEFELVAVLWLSISYAEARGIDEEIAIREILQNALDIEHEAFDYDGINAQIYTSSLGTHIADRGKGVPWVAFIIGVSIKPPEYSRGRFGEGLKLASLSLELKNIPVFIFTTRNGNRIVYRISSLGRKATILSFGKVKKWIGKEDETTNVLVYGYKIQDNLLKLLYWKHNPDLTPALTIKSKRGDRHIAEHIFTDSNKNKKLYVRDLYVNNIKDITGKNSFYSYNIWDVELEPNRKTVKYKWQLNSKMYSMLLRSPQLLSNFLKEVVGITEIAGVPNITLMKAENYAEMDIWHETAERELSIIKSEQPHLIDQLKKCILDSIKTDVLQPYNNIGIIDGETMDVRLIESSLHEGIKVIIAPKPLIPLLKLVYKTAEELFTNSTKSLEEKVDIANLDLTTNITDLQTYAEMIAMKDIVLDQLLKDIGIYDDEKRFAEIDKVKVIPIYTRSFCKPDSIYINIFTTSPHRVFVHELAHLIGFRYKEKLESLFNVEIESIEDLTKGMHRLTEIVGRYLFTSLKHNVYRKLMEKISNNCIGARLHKVYSELYSTSYEIKERIPNKTESSSFFLMLYKKGNRIFDRELVNIMPAHISHTLHKPVINQYKGIIGMLTIHIVNIIEKLYKLLPNYVGSTKEEFFKSFPQEIKDELISYNKTLSKLTDTISLSKYLKETKDAVYVCYSPVIRTLRELLSMILYTIPPSEIHIYSYDLKEDEYEKIYSYYPTNEQIDKIITLKKTTIDERDIENIIDKIINLIYIKEEQ